MSRMPSAPDRVRFLHALRAAISLSALAITSPAVGTAPATIEEVTTLASLSDPDAHLFPRPSILQPSIAFWTKVFSHYSEHQSVVQTASHPDRVLQVLDFREQAVVLDSSRLASLKSREEKAAKERYAEMLLSVSRKLTRPEQLTAEERRIYDLFRDVDDPDRYRRLSSEVRVQRGLKERTHKALESSGKYLPHMESTFERQGLPTRLTRLPLVESSFNEAAYSKVGAAGIWQFMPSSARMYMRLDALVDDRADPWFSTEAAARHLKDDYALLGDWPLAVTAYNHGRGGLARGLQKVGGSSLADLIERYDDKRFGFASRNFYAEFLAASDVERDHAAHFGEVQRRELLRFDQVQTSEYYIPYKTLLRLSGTDEATFRALNPAYRPDVIDGKLYVPPGHTLRLPQGRATAFRTALSKLGKAERHEQQKLFYLQHRVGKGETLASVGKRYGVGLADLRKANPKIGKELRRGSTLRIPTRNTNAIAVASVAAPPPVFRQSGGRLIPVAKKRQEGADFRTHHVRAGQTLWKIAKEYGVTVASLRQVNGLGNSSHLKPGQKLKVPIG